MPVFDEETTQPSSAIPPLPELDFCKCGKGKCPKLRLLDDGGVEISDEEALGGPIRFTREQLREVREWLQKLGF